LFLSDVGLNHETNIVKRTRWVPIPCGNAKWSIDSSKLLTLLSNHFLNIAKQFTKDCNGSVAENENNIRNTFNYICKAQQGDSVSKLQFQTASYQRFLVKEAA